MVAACAGPGWKAGRTLLAPPWRVAEVLGDPPVDDAFLKSSVPAVEYPRGVRTCCAFGMDLFVRYVGVQIPGYRVGNITGNENLGRHEYDNGALSLSANDRMLDLEKNGLVYTCRAGWIDTAHIRDNADLTFFLTQAFLRGLPGPIALDIPGDGCSRRLIEIKPVPAELLRAEGRFKVAAALAEWVAFKLSVWHEISSWYGSESVPGFSEMVSTFSPEDVYSNVIGIRVGTAIARDGGLVSRQNYDDLTEAWIYGTLDRLGAVSKANGRVLMQSLDHKWWDSSKVLPDTRVVTRRYMDVRSPVRPWRVQDALGDREAPPAELTALCPQDQPALELTLPDRVATYVMEENVQVTWVPKEWADARLPFPHAGMREITLQDLPGLLSAIHADLEKMFGPGFDRPGPAPAPAH